MNPQHMNTQTLVHQAVLLNREGIAALACGYGDQAHANFRRVLELLGYISQAPGVVNTNAPAVVDRDNDEEDILASVTPFPICNLECDRFFIYNSALMFEPSATASASQNHPQQQQQQQQQRTDYSQQEVTIWSAAAIFNMALTYNQRAMTGGGGGGRRTAGKNQIDGMLRIASRMYDQSLQVVLGLLQQLPRTLAAGQQPPRVVAKRVERLNVLKMIILNNRSQISYELGQYDEAQQILDEVKRLSQRVATRQQQQPTNDNDNNNNTVPLMTNVLQQNNAFSEIALNVLVITNKPRTAPCA